MIHWLQTVLEKHFKWLFIILLGVIIVSFVFTAGRGITDPTRSSKDAVFYGYDLSNREVVAHLQKGAYISQKLGTASFIMGMQGGEGVVLSRAALLKVAKDLNIPAPDEANLKNFIQSDIPAFQNDKNQFDVDLYKKFIEETTSNPDLGEALTAQFVREEFQIAKLKKLLEVSPASPFEATYQWTINNTQWDIEAAEIDAAKMDPLPQATEADLLNFYNENASLYELPAQRQLTYVLFDPTTFESKDLIDGTLLEAWYNANPNALLLSKVTDADELPEPVPFAEADREAVESAYRKDLALKAAIEAADLFVSELYESGIAYRSDEFEKLLQKNKLTLQTLSAFSQKQLPSGTPFSRRDLQQAFALDAKLYYSDIYELKNGLGVYFLDKEIAPALEDFDNVKSRVALDFKKKAEADAFDAYTKAMEEKLNNLLTDEKLSFKEASEKLGLTFKEWTKFTFEEGAEDFPRSGLEAIGSLKIGERSALKVEGQSAYVFLVRNKVSPDLTDEAKLKMQDDAQSMQKFMSMIFNSQILQQLIFNGFPKSKSTE